MRGVNSFAGAAFTLFLVALTARAGARWMKVGTDVPVSRLISNVGAYVRVHPNDAQGYYVLGRVHSLAFAQSDAKMNVYYKRDLAPRHSAKPAKGNSSLPADELPQFPGYAPVLEGKFGPKQRTWKAESRLHLLASIRNYQRATAL